MCLDILESNTPRPPIEKCKAPAQPHMKNYMPHMERHKALAFHGKVEGRSLSWKITKPQSQCASQRSMENCTSYSRVYEN